MIFKYCYQVKKPLINNSIGVTKFTVICRPLNGEVFIVIPNKLIFFPKQHALPEGTDWVDTDGVRAFSANFYADLFDFLKVTQVFRLDAAAGPEGAAAFEERGMLAYTPEDLGCADETDLFSLQVLDRFIAVASGCEGQLAIQCDARHAAHAHTLVAAYMVRRRHFDSPTDAIAWLAMAHPGRGRAAVDYAVLERLAARAPRARRASCSAVFSSAGSSEAAAAASISADTATSAAVTSLRSGPSTFSAAGAAAPAATLQSEQSRAGATATTSGQRVGPGAPGSGPHVGPGFFRARAGQAISSPNVLAEFLAGDSELGFQALLLGEDGGTPA